MELDEQGNIVKPKPMVIDTNIAMAIRGTARIEVKRDFIGEIHVSVYPAENDSRYSVRVFGNEVFRPPDVEDPIRYLSHCITTPPDSSKCSNRPFHFLIRATELTVGDDLVEHVEPHPESGSAQHSNVLLDGRLRAFNRAWQVGTRYQLAEEELEVGDVLRVAPQNAAEKGDKQYIWGSVSAAFEIEDDKFGDALHVVAHTVDEKIEVRRFGGWYSFGVTKWEVLSSQPVLQFFWITLVSILLITSVFLSILDHAPDSVGLLRFNKDIRKNCKTENDPKRLP